MAVITMYESESGDRGFAGVFERRLTDEEWDSWVEENFPDELVYESEEEFHNCLYKWEVEWDGEFEPIPLPIAEKFQ